MSLRTTSRVVNGVTVLDLEGQIGLGAGSPALREAVRGALQEGASNVLLNLRRVDYVDSSGLGELIAAFVSARNGGGQLKLLHPSSRVAALLKTTKLDTILDVHGDEADAMASFGR